MDIVVGWRDRSNMLAHRRQQDPMHLGIRHPQPHPHPHPHPHHPHPHPHPHRHRHIADSVCKYGGSGVLLTGSCKLIGGSTYHPNIQTTIMIMIRPPS